MGQGTFERDLECPICHKPGHGVYAYVGKSGNRVQSFECPDGCWSTGPGRQIIEQLNAAPAVERD